MLGLKMSLAKSKLVIVGIVAGLVGIFGCGADSDRAFWSRRS
jgi:hypothetical protein